MKVTKRQLRKIIREAIDFSDREANPHDGGMYGEREEEWDEVEYDRGYQDGLDGAPPPADATTDYDAGYEDGKGDATLPDTSAR